MSGTALGKSWDVGRFTSSASNVTKKGSPARRAEYMRGLKDGGDNERRRTTEAFEKHINIALTKAHEHTTEVFNYLREHKMQPLGARLRISNLQEYEVLILLLEKQFLSTKMRKVYDRLYVLRQGWKTADYVITFRFTSANGEKAESHMIGDGFDLSYIKENVAEGVGE